VVFDLAIDQTDIAVFFTLILLEGVLSFDNAAVLAAMVRKLPVEQRRKALLYGLGGAYFFRALAIVFVSFIIANPILKLVGGAYLVYLALSHFLKSKKEHHEIKPVQYFGLSAFWSVVIAVELADIAFALDQVLVAVAMTNELAIIIAASFVAILFLRISAGYMTRLMDWFPQLETLAYLAVGFVGLKLVLVEVVHMMGYKDFEVPKIVSIVVTLSLLVLPVVAKAIYEKVIRKTPA